MWKCTLPGLSLTYHSEETARLSLPKGGLLQAWPSAQPRLPEPEPCCGRRLFPSCLLSAFTDSRPHALWADGVPSPLLVPLPFIFRGNFPQQTFGRSVGPGICFSEDLKGSRARAWGLAYGAEGGGPRPPLRRVGLCPRGPAPLPLRGNSRNRRMPF